MNIRPATLDDLDAICEIEFQEYNHRGYDFVTFRQFLDIFEGTFLVAEESTVTGFIVSAISNNCRDGWVLNLLVKPEYRMKGIGYKLCAETLKQFTGLGTKTIFLTVAPTNAAALHLYTLFGFSKKCLEKNYYGPGADRYLLVKEL
jgi:ribosomal-protein-alanine N-acetyltransferase